MKTKNIFDLDPAIWSMAREAELGELRRVYHTLQYRSIVTTIGVILLASGMLCVILTILAIFFTLWPFFLLTTLSDLFFLVGGGYVLSLRRIYADWHVSVWEAGFLYQKGPLRQIFRWDQIESIQGSAKYASQTDETIFMYKVRRQDGYEVKLNNTFSDIAQLSDTILDGFSRQTSSRELTILPPRDKIFSDFKLDRQGICDKQGTIPWQEMQELTIEKGTIAVLKREAGGAENELERA